MSNASSAAFVGRVSLKSMNSVPHLISCAGFRRFIAITTRAVLADEFRLGVDARAGIATRNPSEFLAGDARLPWQSSSS
jgi:hypothetical protein